jgi:hypothetical protein
MSCAQGRRATRLRYAPTVKCCIESKALWNFLAGEMQFSSAQLFLSRWPNIAKRSMC